MISTDNIGQWGYSRTISDADKWVCNDKIMTSEKYSESLNKMLKQDDSSYRCQCHQGLHLE